MTQNSKHLSVPNYPAMFQNTSCTGIIIVVFEIQITRRLFLRLLFTPRYGALFAKYCWENLLGYALHGKPCHIPLYMIVASYTIKKKYTTNIYLPCGCHFWPPIGLRSGIMYANHAIYTTIMKNFPSVTSVCWRNYSGYLQTAYFSDLKKEIWDILMNFCSEIHGRNPLEYVHTDF